MREPRADMKPKTENTVAGVDERMGLYDGVHCMRLLAGPVLIYRGHTAPGVFVFLSGCVHSGACATRSTGIGGNTRGRPHARENHPGRGRLFTADESQDAE